MQPAVIPRSMVAERHRLGLDHRDEMWEGMLHMNEPGSFVHRRMVGDLLFVLGPLAGRLGVTVLPSLGVFDPDVPDYWDFRTPDVVVVRPDEASERGVEGRASLVIEVRSPGDESFEKIPFYGRVGVAEMLIVDRDSKEVRRWLNHDGQLEEISAGPDRWHELDSLPVAFRGADGSLEMRIDGRIEAV